MTAAKIATTGKISVTASPYSGIDLSGEIEIDDTEENPPQDPNADPETDFTQRGD
ncbi:hypothetical protein GVA88_003778 [Salmonella enterica]|nr:hypothetical protein [Salmonella enterica]